MYIVFFVTVIQDEEDGVFIDDAAYGCGYLGGIVEDFEQAEGLAKHIVNDKCICGAIIPKIFPYNGNLESCCKIAKISC